MELAHTNPCAAASYSFIANKFDECKTALTRNASPLFRLKCASARGASRWTLRWPKAGKRPIAGKPLPKRSQNSKCVARLAARKSKADTPRSLRRISGLCQNYDIVHFVSLANESLLRSHGLSVTAQRLALLQTISDHPHITADQAAEVAREQLGTISRQSVYDTLNTLVEKGLARRIQPIDSPALFEDRVGDNHHHLVCRSCGLVTDVDCAVGARPCLEASNSNGFIIDEADVTYWGECPACQQTSKSQVTHQTRKENQ